MRAGLGVLETDVDDISRFCQKQDCCLVTVETEWSREPPVMRLWILSCLLCCLFLCGCSARDADATRRSQDAWLEATGGTFDGGSRSADD